VIPISLLPAKRGERRGRDSTIRVLLVDNFWVNQSSAGYTTNISPHLGLMNLAAVLREASHETRILDPKILYLEGAFDAPSDKFYDDCAEACLAQDCDVIGFTAYGRTLPSAVRMAQGVHARSPAMPILLGGPHATIVGREILKAFDCFSAVVRYEAEINIVELVEALAFGEDLSTIPNLVIRTDGEILETERDHRLVDLETLLPPALDLYPRRYVTSVEMSIEAGRGCPFACTFCSTANFFQRKYRLKTNETIIREMESARREFGVGLFNLNHDLFGLNRSGLLEFCRLVKDRGFSWKCSMRPDTLRIKDVTPLKAAGCTHIYFGIETGSPKLQRVTKKRLRLDRATEVVRAAADAGINCTVSFITGFPEETEDDQRRTLDLLGSLLEIDPGRIDVQLHMLSPEPGSELIDGDTSCLFDGIGPEADATYDPLLIAKYPEVFSVFYHFTSSLPRWRVVLASALVNEVLPRVGKPLFAHLVREHFSGHLSTLFDALFPASPADPLDGYGAIHSLLRAKFDETCSRFTAPETRDAIVLAGILRSVRHETTSPTAPPEEVADLWIAKFLEPIEQAFAHLRLPLVSNNAIRPSAADRGPFHYLLSPSPGGVVEVFPLADPDVASVLEIVGAAGSARTCAGLASEGFARVTDSADYRTFSRPTIGGHCEG